MNLPDLLHQAGPLLLKAATALVGALLVKYKKPIEAFCIGLGKRLLGRPVSSLDEELEELRDAGLERIETLLYLLLRDPDYKADRVTIFLYVAQEDGGALATCEVEVRVAEMQSMRSLNQTPISEALRSEIWGIDHLPGKELYVPDARATQHVALRAALPASGAWSAYFQLMPARADKKGQPQERRLLTMSWEASHSLSPAQLAQLHLSGLACAAVLELMSRARQMQAK
jgi:hypothetical protein